MTRFHPTNKNTRKNVSRRAFVRSAAAVSLFHVVPRHAAGAGGGLSPSDKLNIAGCGVGGKGYSDLTSVQSENIYAICDIDRRLAGRAHRHFPRAKHYQDFRVMLDKEKSLDAVIVATPDHNHAVISMAAIKRGKHVYCQKPLTHTVYEARQLAEAARKHKVATQMGNQGQASETTRRICEFIQDGAIGKVNEVHIWTDRHLRGLHGVYWPQGIDRPAEKPPVPDGLNWDLWLGPAPERPYHPAYTPFKWRGWWDFGTGALGDIGCHAMDSVFRALKLKAPVSFQACSTHVNKETYPCGSIVQYQFPERDGRPPVKLFWYDGGMKPMRPELLDEGAAMDTNGKMYIGEKGIILDNRIYPKSRRDEYKEPPKTLPRSPGHYREWLIQCKGGKPAGSNFDWAGPLTETVLLGNVALHAAAKEKLVHVPLSWDSEKFTITNMPEANKYLHTQYRKGWTL